jgi:hypothetical protein
VSKKQKEPMNTQQTMEKPKYIGFKIDASTYRAIDALAKKHFSKPGVMAKKIIEQKVEELTKGQNND